MIVDDHPDHPWCFSGLLELPRLLLGNRLGTSYRQEVGNLIGAWSVREALASLAICFTSLGTPRTS